MSGENEVIGLSFLAARYDFGESMKIIRTSQVEHQYLKILTYAQSAGGKTRLCATAPNPVVVSAEAGLLSLRDYDLPAIQVATLADVQEAYKYIAESEEMKDIEWVCIDSISEIAEVVLATEKRNAKDPRRAYGEMQDRMTSLIRAFRDLPKNVYMSCKQERVADESGVVGFGPSMPGTKLSQQLPYFFDEVFCLRVNQNEEGQTQRFLQTQPDGIYQAKDRSGVLDRYEIPHLGKIAEKMKGTK